MKLILLNSQIDKVINNIKTHAIVSDPNNKVKIGKKIDYRMENNQRYFNPTIISKQTIEIAVRKNANSYELIYLQIDKQDCSSKLNDLSVNEGFNSVQEFLNFIYESAEEFPRVTLHVLRGKILHWTDCQY